MRIYLTKIYSDSFCLHTTYIWHSKHCTTHWIITYIILSIINNYCPPEGRCIYTLISWAEHAPDTLAYTYVQYFELKKLVGRRSAPELEQLAVVLVLFAPTLHETLTILAQTPFASLVMVASSFDCRKLKSLSQRKCFADRWMRMCMLLCAWSRSMLVIMV